MSLILSTAWPPPIQIASSPGDSSAHLNKVCDVCHKHGWDTHIHKHTHVHPWKGCILTVICVRKKTFLGPSDSIEGSEFALQAADHF